MSEILRYPALLFGFGVAQLRRLPGARLVAPLVPWLGRLLIAAAVVLLLLWAAETSPQRISLADLAAGKLGAMQSWIIVSGNLEADPSSSGAQHRYRLTHPAAPNARLDVRSPVELALGPTTVSGRIEGGRDGVPAGYAWSARLNADDRLADELPPPWSAGLLAGIGVLLFVARGSRYPIFVPERPADIDGAEGLLRVTAYGEDAAGAERDAPATLDFDTRSGGTAELRIKGGRPIQVRLHSAFTSVDVGRLRRLLSSEPVLRVRASTDDLTIGFASRRDRDAAYATLAAGALARVPGRRA